MVKPLATGSRSRLLAIAACIAAAGFCGSELSLFIVRGLIEARQHDRAGRWLAFARATSPRRGEVHFLAARLARRQGRFGDLRNELLAARAAGWPVDALEREQWIAQAQAGQVAAMEPHWGELFGDAGSDAPEIFRAFVVAALRRGRLAEARQVIDAWESDLPDDPEAHVLAAAIHGVRQEWAAAEQRHARALALAAPGSDAARAARRGLASALMRRLRFDEAAAAWGDVLAEEPLDEPAAVGRSQCLLDLGRLDEARDAIRAFLAQRPESTPARELLGRIDLAAGDAAAAVESLRLAAAAKPEDAELRYALGRSLKLAGLDEEAAGHLAYRTAAEAPLDRLRDLENAIPARPDDADLRAEIAEIVSRWKSREEGLAWFRTVLDIDPAHPRARAAIAAHEATAAARPAVGGDRGSRDSVAGAGGTSGSGPSRHPAEAGGASAAGMRSVVDVMPPSFAFVDRATERGVSFTAVNGEEAERLTILETVGSGIGVLDLDGDGDDDLCLAGGGRFEPGTSLPMPAPSGLFRNDGAGRFTPVADEARLPRATFYSHGVNVGDYDGDGCADLLITGYDGVALLQNMGDGTLRVVPVGEHGLDGAGWNTSAAWLDADADGCLDLYICRYVDWSPDNDPPCMLHDRRDVCPPARFAGVDDRLYRSDGAGRFLETGPSSGIVSAGKGLGVVAADLDLDGDTDLYVANDTTANVLYRNRGGGSFEECGLVAGVAVGPTGQPDGSMGVDCGDATLDGLPDLWVANFENQSFGLYRNYGDLTFENISAAAGVTAVGAVYVGFGTMFVDVDLDGAEDIFVTNGHVMRHPLDSPVRQRPLLLRNVGGRRMVNVAPTAGRYCESQHMGRGAVAADLDCDGDDDIVVSHTNEPAALLVNETPQRGRRLMIALVGGTANRECVGASAILETVAAATEPAAGDAAPDGFGSAARAGSASRRKHLRLVKGGGSYLSTGPRRLVWGLLPGERPVRLSITWPDGSVTETPWTVAEGGFIVRQAAADEPVAVARRGRSE